MSVPTSLDGLTVFGRVETANGRRNIFEIIDGVAASINPLRELNEHATADVRAEAIFTLPRQNQTWELDPKEVWVWLEFQLYFPRGMRRILLMQ